jgi:hypothetical protein
MDALSIVVTGMCLSMCMVYLKPKFYNSQAKPWEGLQPPNPHAFENKGLKAKPWALPKPTREIISLDP